MREVRRPGPIWTPWDTPEEHLRPDGARKESDEIATALLRAVQTHDSAAAFGAIRQMVVISGEEDVLPALKRLPRTTITSIFRLVDPFSVGSHIDHTHNIRVDERLQEISGAGLAVDENGVRHIYKQLLVVLESFAQLLISAHGTLLPTEYQALLRCAGATSDAVAARRIWQMMPSPEDPGSIGLRDAPTYDAFIRSKYLTEDLFAQNDVRRTMHLPRHVRGFLVNRVTRRRLARHRIALAYRTRYGHGASPTEPTKEIGFTTSGRLPLLRITKSMHSRGIVPDERLTTAMLRAKGRVGAVNDIFHFLKNHYGFTVSLMADHRDPQLRFKIDKVALARPSGSAGMLESTVATLGILGFSLLARRFLEFVSSEHQIKIPRKAWTSLLKYTFAAQAARREYEIFNATPGVRNQVVRSRDVIAVWDSMMADGQSPIPTAEERDIYVQALVLSGRYDEALLQIRRGIEDYREATDKVRYALLATLYPNPPRSTRLAFTRAKTTQHTLWNNIATWCRMYMWAYTRHIRGAAPMATQEIPDLVAEFKDFTDGTTKYRTSTGIIRLNDDAARKRHLWLRQDFQSRTIETLTPNFDDPVLDDAGQQKIHDETGQPLYNNKKLLLSRHNAGWGRQRKPPVWEKLGLRICLSQRPGKTHLRPEEASRCVEW